MAFSFLCARCGATAATLEAYAEPTTIDLGPVADGEPMTWQSSGPAYRLEFLGVNVGVTTPALVELLDGTQPVEPEAIRAIDPELGAFWCAACRASYCRDCWRTAIEFDEGFYDLTRGWCPDGHEQVLDD